MGKTGIPMTVVMQGAGGSLVYNEPSENAGPKNEIVGSLYYGADGKPTMTASAFNAGGNV